MTHTQQMIEAHPVKPALEVDVLGRCIDACHDAVVA